MVHLSTATGLPIPWGWLVSLPAFQLTSSPCYTYCLLTAIPFPTASMFSWAPLTLSSASATAIGDTTPFWQHAFVAPALLHYIVWPLDGTVLLS